MARQTRMTNRFLADSSELKMIGRTVPMICANGTAGRFNETVTYNPNGSIISLLRNGMKNDGTFGAIDDLTITYDGNRLLKVTDDAEAVNYNGALDFHDGSDEDSEYEYDTNGGLTQDKNRGITGITYDYGHNTEQHL